MNKVSEYVKIILNIIIPLLGVILIGIFLPKLLVFFWPFVMGWLIAAIANPLVKFLEQKIKIVRKHSSAIIIIGVIALIVLALYLVTAKFASEFVSMLTEAPEMIQNLKEEYIGIVVKAEEIFERLPKDYQEMVTKMGDSITANVTNWVESVGKPLLEGAKKTAQNVPAILIGVIVMFMSAYFFVAEREFILKWYHTYMPQKFQVGFGNVVRDFKNVVGGYFKAQFKIMAVVYLILVIGLYILRIRYSLLIALGIAFLDMLPFFGTGTVLGPWAIINIISGDYKMAVGMVILYLVTQLVRQVIQPKFLGDSIGMNPLAALFVMYVGYKLYGVLGMLFAVPVAMILVNLCKSGIFDNMLISMKMLVDNINEFRKY